MKKKLLYTLFIALIPLGFTSCDMNLMPPGSVYPDNALQTIDDAKKLRDGFYVAFRGATTGSVNYLQDLGTDLYHATVGFGNRGGTQYFWQTTADDPDAKSFWANRYYYIANTNFFIEKANLVNKSEWSAENIATLKLWKGEAFFFRAFYHWQLADKYCLAYSEANKGTYGVPYMKRYEATSDASKYPSRGTLEDTYKNILEDLDSAAAYITTEGTPKSTRITVDALNAFRARIALYHGDYQQAVDLASALVNSGKYQLTSTPEAFNAIWTDTDASQSEDIVQLFVSYEKGEMPNNNNYGFIGYDGNAKKYQYVDYLPEQWLIDIYPEKDIRFGTYFKEVKVEISSYDPGIAYIFYKYVGDQTLKTPGSANNSERVAPKPFRIAEVHLILAEAYYRLGQAAKAQDALTALRAKRIPGYTPGSTSDLLEEIRIERIRELIGEGSYVTDLKRFGKDVERKDAVNPALIYMPGTYQDYHVSANDPRFLWPIPKEEIDANPNIKNEQNPGY